MSSFWAGLTKDLSQIKKEWYAEDSTVRLLDLISLFGIMIFGVTFIVVSVMAIIPTLTNMAFMIYPIIISGYTFTLRSKLSNPDVDNKAARKEFLGLVSITTLLVLFTFVYSAIL